MSYKISIATEQNINCIAQFQVAMAMESEGLALNPEVVRAGVTAAMTDESKGIYIIAQLNNDVVGSLMLTREWSDWNNAWYWWIQSVYVTPEHRQKGVYTQMYGFVKQLAKERNVSQVRLYADKTNLRAQNTYRKLGMTESHYIMFEEEI